MTAAHPLTRARAPLNPFAVLLSLLGLLAPSTATAAVVFVKWDKPHKGSRANVVALDLGARKILWQAAPGKVVNFVVETTNGILVGTDEGTVVMLSAADGSVLWKTFLEKAQVTGFQGETLGGIPGVERRREVLAGRSRRKADHAVRGPVRRSGV